MIPVRKQLTIGDGVTVDLLVTPHISVLEAETGIQPIVSEDSTTLEVMERYADLMYLAALNAWVLDFGKTLDDFPHKRGDFHAFMAADRKGFADAVLFMMSALTGKTRKELAKEETATPAEPVKKKSFFYRLTHRSRSSSSGHAESPSGRRL